MEAEVGKMPRTKAESKIRVDCYIPAPLKSEIEQIAEADGWTVAEFYRLLILDGLSAYSEKSNKRLVNEKMRSDRIVRNQLESRIH
jgi:hypothetical protein